MRQIASIQYGLVSEQALKWAVGRLGRLPDSTAVGQYVSQLLPYGLGHPFMRVPASLDAPTGVDWDDLADCYRRMVWDIHLLLLALDDLRSEYESSRQQLSWIIQSERDLVRSLERKVQQLRNADRQRYILYDTFNTPNYIDLDASTVHIDYAQGECLLPKSVRVSVRDRFVVSVGAGVVSLVASEPVEVSGVRLSVGTGALVSIHLDDRLVFESAVAGTDLVEWTTSAASTITIRAVQGEVPIEPVVDDVYVFRYEPTALLYSTWWSVPEAYRWAARVRVILDSEQPPGCHIEPMVQLRYLTGPSAQLETGWIAASDPVPVTVYSTSTTIALPGAGSEMARPGIYRQRVSVDWASDPATSARIGEGQVLVQYAGSGQVAPLLDRMSMGWSRFVDMDKLCVWLDSAVSQLGYLTPVGTQLFGSGGVPTISEGASTGSVLFLDHYGDARAIYYAVPLARLSRRSLYRFRQHIRLDADGTVTIRAGLIANAGVGTAVVRVDGVTVLSLTPTSWSAGLDSRTVDLRQGWHAVDVALLVDQPVEEMGNLSQLLIWSVGGLTVYAVPGDWLRVDPMRLRYDPQFSTPNCYSLYSVEESAGRVTYLECYLPYDPSVPFDGHHLPDPARVVLTGYYNPDSDDTLAGLSHIRVAFRFSSADGRSTPILRSYSIEVM